MPYRFVVDFHHPAFVASAPVGYLCAQTARTRSTWALVAGGSWSYMIVLSRDGGLVQVGRGLVVTGGAVTRDALCAAALPHPASTRTAVPTRRRRSQRI